MTIVTQPSDLRQYPGRFDVVREGDNYAAIIPQPVEMQVNTYHRSPRRTYSVFEPVPNTGYHRIDMTAAEARAIIEALQVAGRAPAANVIDMGDGRWQYVVDAEQRTEAEKLAEAGAARKPELAERMTKAAALVDAGAVRLTGQQTAVVNDYTVTAGTCTCKDFEHRAPGGWCKHRLAVRMARALGQAIQPLTEAEDRRMMETQRAQRQAETAARVDQANYDERRRQAQARRDGMGAERWITVAAANGQQAIPESFYRRAHGDPDVLAAAKAQAKANIKQIFGGD